MEEVKVLSYWSSPFGMRVQIGLEEKGVKYEYQEENVYTSFWPSPFGMRVLQKNGVNKSDLLLRMNPVYKKIPVLIHNGNPICESLIILQYIDEAWPASHAFTSADPYERALARFWADFFDKKIHDAAIRIIRSKGEAQEEAKRDLVENLEHLEGALKQMPKGGPYFFGEEFGLVDIAFIPFTSWFHSIETIGNFKLPLETRFPLVHAWVKKCMERESVRKVVPTPERVLEFALQMRKKIVGD